MSYLAPEETLLGFGRRDAWLSLRMCVHEERATLNMRVQGIMSLWVVLHHGERRRHATCKNTDTRKTGDVETVREAIQRP